MISQRAEFPVVAFSVKVYQVLLFAYPTEFQQEYGTQMVHVFQDCCLRSLRQGGTKGILRLWAVTFLDLIQSVVSEHSQKEVEMKKEMRPEDIRRAGWALIWGAISLVLGILLAYLEDSNWYMLALLVLVFISLPLLVFGILGLRNRYGEKVGSFGKNILLIGTILGPLTTILGFLLMSIEPLWIITWAGPAVLFVCLAVFGVVALDKKPMPRWNLLPVIAGLSYPAIIIFYIITSIVTGDWTGSRISAVISLLLIFIQGIALLALGYILKADVPNETTVIA